MVTTSGAGKPFPFLARAAVRWGLEEGEGELLVGEADVEEDEARGGVGDEDLADGEPEEELLLGDADQGAEAAVGEIGPDHAVEEDHSIEPGVAGAAEPDLELAGRPIQGVGIDLPGEEPPRQAVSAEDVVDGTGGRRRREGGGSGDGPEGEEERRKP